MANERSRYFQDFFLVLRSQLVPICFILILAFLFLITAQGQDVALCVVEDLAFFHPATTLFMLLGLFFWSISTRFCSRMITFLTDNSGHELSPNSVRRRKRIQRTVSDVLGIAPVALAFIAFIRVGVNAVFGNQYIQDKHELGVTVSNVLILVAIAGMGLLCVWLYCRLGIERVARKYKKLQWLILDRIERRWVYKLYGLFSDLRFQMTQVTAVSLKIDPTKALPVETTLPDGRRLPAGTPTRPAFTLCPGYPRAEGNSLIVWMYQIPVRFYRSLANQFRILLIVSVCTILVFAFNLSGYFYSYVGTIGCVFIAAGCWLAIYTLAHYLDKVKYRWRYPVPIRTILFILFCLTTFFNRDHPVREYSSAMIADTRMPLGEHFRQWFGNLTVNKGVGHTSWVEPDGRIPVIFVTAEGGALRTGAFTTILLSKLTDSFPDIDRYIYAYSSVSGGTIGCNIFQALTRLKNKDSTQQFPAYAKLADTFYEQDFLAPAVGKFAFGEVINYYIPWHVPVFDRAIALEHAWEDAFALLSGSGDNSRNYLSAAYFDSGMTAATSPALFTNTVEVETGRQCIWSNVRIDSLPRGKQRDLFGRYRFDIPYSTATNLSSRFPLLSPAAAFYPKKVDSHCNPRASHYVDGGYYENKGSETMLQVLQHLEVVDSDLLRNVRPYVIQINFGSDDDSSKTPVRAFSDIMEIIGGIANSRGARGELQQQYLQYETLVKLKGVFISVAIPSNGKDVPNDWVLSYRAVEHIRSVTDSIIRRQGRYEKVRDGLWQLFPYR